MRSSSLPTVSRLVDAMAARKSHDSSTVPSAVYKRSMIISGTSGNEIYCLSLKGLAVGEMVVGNSVFSLGLGGWLQSMGITIAGGEVSQITQIIAEGRHAAIGRMEQEAQKHGASGVAGVVSDVTSLAGYTEFLAQGTAVHASDAGPFFSTSASGIDLYCHLDAGYTPVRFA